LIALNDILNKECDLKDQKIKNLEEDVNKNQFLSRNNSNMQASKIEAELEDLKTSHNNILLVFYKFLNDVIKFSPNEISLKDTELLFHNPDMKEMLIKRILLYSADSK